MRDRRPQTKAKTGAPAIGGEVVIEHADGRLEELREVRQEFNLLIHGGTHQVFPVRDMVPSYTLSLDGPYTMYEGDVYYYDDELINPDADPVFVFGVSEAACIAAERGELQSDHAQTHKARLNMIAALGGIGFPILASILSGANFSWLG